MGGQGIATDADGRKVFVWNALPGETVEASIIKRKRGYADAVAENIITASELRAGAKEPEYLSTSPWQILKFSAENEFKRQLALDAMAAAKVTLPEAGQVITDLKEWHYRNKMEYSFWGDDRGLHLALHKRGSHTKQIVTGSRLALDAVNAAAQAVCAELQIQNAQKNMNIRAGNLKTIVVRSSQNGSAAASLFVKQPDFPQINLPAGVNGLKVYFSDPRSPASVRTNLIYELGSCDLQDQLLGKNFSYSCDSFFQVNIPVYGLALKRIKEFAGGHLLDMYAGVGSIGLSMGADQLKLVELDAESAGYAAANAKAILPGAEVIKASAEKALDKIAKDTTIIFDPPRAGLHRKVISKLLEILPPRLVYLSCNPATQARDLALLSAAYKVDFFEVYNFFPKTPHIETLAVLNLI